jgi:hypothetical protein
MYVHFWECGKYIFDDVPLQTYAVSRCVVKALEEVTWDVVKSFLIICGMSEV